MQERVQRDESDDLTSLKSFPLGNHRIFYFFKRVIDILFGCIGFIIFIILYLFVWLANRVENDNGPVLYKQQRIGLGGETFSILKFRSMKVNAEQILRNDSNLYQKYISNGYKLKPDEDPRITKIGRIIRKTSLDEFPQFINVLIGNMSIVGPRPVVKTELKEYGDDASKFIALKPGITGIWSSTGRSEIGYPERCSLELEYGRHHNIIFDLSIIWRTFIKVIKKEGAY